MSYRIEMNLRLPCNYRVIGALTSRKGTFVACHLPDNEVTPYATWNVGEDGACHLGHYLKNRRDAIESLIERADSKDFIY